MAAKETVEMECEVIIGYRRGEKIL
jgi:hypothetical protein